MRLISAAFNTLPEGTFSYILSALVVAHGQMQAQQYAKTDDASVLIGRRQKENRIVRPHAKNDLS